MEIRCKGQPVLTMNSLDGLAFVGLAGQELERQQVLQLALEPPSERNLRDVFTIELINFGKINSFVMTDEYCQIPAFL